MAVSKPRIFVSYHHAGDQGYYDAFSKLLHDIYDCVYDNSLERRIDSDDVLYVRRRIRENYITGTSCTFVLCGVNTPGRKYVDWEVAATLDKKHGLIAVKLPTLVVVNDGCWKPARVQANIDSGYALWRHWEAVVAAPERIGTLIAEACTKSSSLIVNDAPLRARNS